MQSFSYYTLQLELLYEQLQQLETKYPKRGRIFQKQTVQIIERAKRYNDIIKNLGIGYLCEVKGTKYVKYGEMLIPFPFQIYVVGLKLYEVRKWVKFKYPQDLIIESIKQIETGKLIVKE